MATSLIHSPFFPEHSSPLYEIMIWVLCCDYISEQLAYVFLLLFTFVKMTHLIQVTAAADHSTDSAVDTLEDYKHQSSAAYIITTVLRTCVSKHKNMHNLGVILILHYNNISKIQTNSKRY